MKQLILTVKEIFEVVVIATITVLLIRYFVIQPFLVSGASMEPNFSDGNYLLIDEITYRFREPQRGEVVVFRYPLDRSVFFIKRLIGFPGDHIVIREGRVMVNNRSLTEDYLRDNIVTRGEMDIKLKKDQYFVLGDNRSYSFDSRNWGPIKRSDIIGLTRLRILPLNKLAAFSYQ
jgi:signal peptidase I